MPPNDTKLIASNRQARRNYDVLETIEAGLVLRGSEVKSLREAKVQLREAYARIDGDEAWLVGLHIAPYLQAASHSGHEPERRRKLLLHRSEIVRLKARVDQDGLTLVPMALYFKEGRAKLELGLARGRRHYDKRQVIAKRDAQRDVERSFRRG